MGLNHPEQHAEMQAFMASLTEALHDGLFLVAGGSSPVRQRFRVQAIYGHIFPQFAQLNISLGNHVLPLNMTWSEDFPMDVKDLHALTIESSMALGIQDPEYRSAPKTPATPDACAAWAPWLLKKGGFPLQLSVQWAPSALAGTLPPTGLPICTLQATASGWTWSEQGNDPHGIIKGFGAGPPRPIIPRIMAALDAICPPGSPVVLDPDVASMHGRMSILQDQAILDDVLADLGTKPRDPGSIPHLRRLGAEMHVAVRSSDHQVFTVIGSFTAYD